MVGHWFCNTTTRRMIKIHRLQRESFKLFGRADLREVHVSDRRRRCLRLDAQRAGQDGCRYTTDLEELDWPREFHPIFPPVSAPFPLPWQAFSPATFGLGTHPRAARSAGLQPALGAAGGMNSHEQSRLKIGAPAFSEPRQDGPLNCGFGVRGHVRALVQRDMSRQEKRCPAIALHVRPVPKRQRAGALQDASRSPGRLTLRCPCGIRNARPTRRMRPNGTTRQ